MDDYSKFIKSYFWTTAPGEVSCVHLIVEVGDDRPVASDEFSNTIVFACGYSVDVYNLDPNKSNYRDFSILKEPPADIPICEKCAH